MEGSTLSEIQNEEQDQEEEESSSGLEIDVEPEDTETKPETTTTPAQVPAQEVPTTLVPRGRPKSGRSWKEPSPRATVIKNGAKQKDLAELREKRQQEKERRELLNQLKKEKEEEKQQEKEKRLARKRRREENIIKGSTYQVITNTSKLKRMSKKQKKNVMKLADLKNT
eukprot:TRINITY_DN5021_c0_g1_i1.p1 TRINITY_DN5021_c0_g1~~TRINITY_DN5021_c0_g1_i1.p1  ORF type:complete len:169 (-),score=61.18 TRINITY_DN5021_c0_g1_i1:106-612(-)